MNVYQKCSETQSFNIYIFTVKGNNLYYIFYASFVPDFFEFKTREKCSQSVVFNIVSNKRTVVSITGSQPYFPRGQF